MGISNGGVRGQDRRRALAVALVAGAVAFLAAALVVSPELGGLGGDDAEYVLLARALREQAAYVTTWQVGGDVPHTTYPPLLPLLLVPVTGSAPASLLGAHLLLAAAGGLAVALLTLLAWRRGVPAVAAAAALVGAALSPLWLRCAADVLSELPFLALVAGALLALEWDRGSGEPRSTRRSLLAACCAALAVLTRTAAVALVPWVLVSLLARRLRGGRRGALPALLLVAVTAGWFAYGALAESGRTYVDVLTSGEGASGAALLPRAWAALTTEYLPHLPAFFFPGVGGIWDAAGLALWGLAAVGMGVGIARARAVRPGDGFAVTYLAMLCAWNFRDPRFGVPLVPVVALLAIEGCVALAHAVRGASLRAGGVSAVLLGALLVAPNAAGYVSRTLPRASRDAPRVPGAPRQLATPDVAGFHETWRLGDEAFATGGVAVASYRLLCEALRSDPSAPPGPLLAANPRVAALLSGRRCTTTAPDEPPSAALARMRRDGVALLLVDSFTDPRSSAVREIVRKRGGDLTPIARIGNAHLFRLRPVR